MGHQGAPHPPSAWGPPWAQRPAGACLCPHRRGPANQAGGRGWGLWTRPLEDPSAHARSPPTGFSQCLETLPSGPRDGSVRGSRTELRGSTPKLSPPPRSLGGEAWPVWAQEWCSRPKTLWPTGGHVLQDIVGPWGGPLLLHLACRPAHPGRGRSSCPMPALPTHSWVGT